MDSKPPSKASIINLKLLQSKYQLKQLVDAIPFVDPLNSEYSDRNSKKCIALWEKFDSIIASIASELIEKVFLDTYTSIMTRSYVILIILMYCIDVTSDGVCERYRMRLMIHRGKEQWSQIKKDNEGKNLTAEQQQGLTIMEGLITYYEFLDGYCFQTRVTNGLTLGHGDHDLFFSFKKICHQMMDSYAVYSTHCIISTFCQGCDLIHTLNAMLQHLTSLYQRKREYYVNFWCKDIIEKDLDELINLKQMKLDSSASWYEIDKNVIIKYKQNKAFFDVKSDEYIVKTFDMLLNDKYNISLRKMQNMATFFMIDLFDISKKRVLFEFNIINPCIIRNIRVTLFFLLLRYRYKDESKIHDYAQDWLEDNSDLVFQVEARYVFASLSMLSASMNVSINDTSHKYIGSIKKFVIPYLIEAEKIMHNVEESPYSYVRLARQSRLSILVYLLLASVLVNDWKLFDEYLNKPIPTKNNYEWPKNWAEISGLIKKDAVDSFIYHKPTTNSQLYLCRHFCQGWICTLVDKCYDNLNCFNKILCNFFNSIFCSDHDSNEKSIAWRNIALSKECNVCNRKQKVLKKCKHCRNVFYCSKECQKIDWNLNNHKAICGMQMCFESSD